MMAESAPTKFTALRDGFAAIREMLFVLAILALFLVPSTVRTILSEAGIRSFAGVEFDESTLEKVKEAGGRVAELEEQLAIAQRELSSMSQSADHRADPRFGTISKLLADAQLKAARTGENLDEAKDKQINLRSRAGQSPYQSDFGSRTESDTATIQQALMPPDLLFQR